MPHRGRQAQPLDPLRSPLRRDLIAGSSPHFLRVAFKEGEVELPPKAVDQEISKALLRPDPAHAREEITDPNLHRPHRAQIFQRGRRQRDRVVEELPQIINPALPRTNQHHQIGIGRCPHRHHRFALCVLVQRVFSFDFDSKAQRARATKHWFLNQAGRYGHRAAHSPIAHSRGARIVALERHQVEPPLHHPAALGKEAMATDIHSVAVVADGPREAADLVAGLEHNGNHITAPEKLQRGRQSSRPRADDDRSSLHPHRYAACPASPALSI